LKKKLIRITTVPISLKILLKDQLKFMNNYFEVIGISSNEKELLEVNEIEGIRTISLDMSREITPIKDFTSLIKMIIILLKEKPDIVHTHTPKAGIIGMVASWICRIPYRLHTVAGLPVMEAVGKKKKLLLLVEKLTYFCATNIYPNSIGLEDYILENKLTKKEKLKIIGYGSSNGIDTNYFQRTDEVIEKASELKIKFDLENKFVFSFVGRIVKDKGIDELLYAFNRLSKEYENIKLLLIGKFEDDLDPISNESKNILDKNDFIINVGFQNDIRPYLVASNCFVLPTYREGFPNVVLQSCSMELPCIVTNINGCNEIIQNNENGIIVEPKNQKELYRAMENFLDDNCLVKKLSSNTRLNIIEKYDRQQFFKYLLDEYNRILNK
jgi:glycosyltransferase involved in cell wall biosynthesis